MPRNNSAGPTLVHQAILGLPLFDAASSSRKWASMRLFNAGVVLNVFRDVRPFSGNDVILV